MTKIRGTLTYRNLPIFSPHAAGQAVLAIILLALDSWMMPHLFRKRDE